MTGEEPPRHSGELNRAPSQAGGPTQSQLSSPVLCRQDTTKLLQFNSDTNASNEIYVKEIQEKRRNSFTHTWATPDLPLLSRPQAQIEFSQKKIVLSTIGTSGRFFAGFGKMEKQKKRKNWKNKK